MVNATPHSQNYVHLAGHTQNKRRAEKSNEWLEICEIIFSKDQSSIVGKLGKRRSREKGFQIQKSLSNGRKKNNYETSISSNIDYIPWATLLPEATKKADKTSNNNFYIQP